MPVLCCSMCSFQASDRDTLVLHVCKIHRHDPNFLIYCSRCLRSFRVWETYKKHLYRGCKEEANNVTSEDTILDISEDDNTMDISGYLEEGPGKSILIDPSSVIAAALFARD